MPNELREPDRPATAGETVTTSGDDRDVNGPGRSDGPTVGATDAERERFDERLRAVERALTGSDDPVADVADTAAATAERAELESRLDDLEARVEELEAATQALRGYAGSIRAVNREVERRADLALARATDGIDPQRDDAGRDDRRSAAAADVSGEDAIHAAVPDEDAIDAAVPDEDAIDAAVPSNPTNAVDGEFGGSADRGGEENDEGSWRDGALDRLRESL